MTHQERKTPNFDTPDYTVRRSVDKNLDIRQRAYNLFRTALWFIAVVAVFYLVAVTLVLPPDFTPPEKSLVAPQSLLPSVSVNPEQANIPAVLNNRDTTSEGISVLPVATEQPDNVADSYTHTTTAQPSLRVREHPSSNSTILQRLKPGTRVTLIGRCGKGREKDGVQWGLVRVETNGKRGYVACQYLKGR